MKTLIIATAAAIALAAPVSAASFKGGDATAFALQHFAASHESGDGPRRNLAANKTGDVSFTTKGNSLTARAKAILTGGERGSDADDE